MNGDGPFIELFSVLYREEHSQIKIVQKIQKIAADARKARLLSAKVETELLGLGPRPIVGLV